MFRIDNSASFMPVNSGLYIYRYIKHKGYWFLWGKRSIENFEQTLNKVLNCQIRKDIAVKTIQIQ